jgi:signal transduction histidine kinase
MLALAAAAVAILLQGVVSLSERRGAFVSAVTHELRTPLTTFRMYSEMLAENMVPNHESRQRYLDTLRVEADRLFHLVENVLAYARLERGRHGRVRQATTLSAIIEHCQHRFADRAEQAGMKLVIEPPPDAAPIELTTDPAAVEQILFNLIDNACKYAAGASDPRIHLEFGREGRYAVLTVRDHGPGIDAKAARRLFHPFSKSVHAAACSAPGVGLGLALSRRLARQLGGRLEWQESADGATFALYLPH